MLLSNQPMAVVKRRSAIWKALTFDLVHPLHSAIATSFQTCSSMGTPHPPLVLTLSLRAPAFLLILTYNLSTGEMSSDRNTGRASHSPPATVPVPSDSTISAAPPPAPSYSLSALCFTSYNSSGNVTNPLWLASLDRLPHSAVARVAMNGSEREKGATTQLRSSLANQWQAQLSLTQENNELKGIIVDLQRRLDESNAIVDEMRIVPEEKDRVVVKMRKKVFESEAIRRKLHNTILELKGNIRVFACVRLVLPSDLPFTVPLRDWPGSAARIVELDDEGKERVKEDVKAKFAFPDEEEHKDIVLYSTSESAMGNVRKEVYTFGFDRVFEPHSTQLEVFEEMSQLAQSCVDGYNVCIFAYGQTGSGRSWTMEGGPTEGTAGMIPRAVEQVFRIAEEMKDKGWEYRIEGQFLEIYNETIHDLLTPFDASDQKKHEIKHDPKTGRTIVTELTVVPLTSPEQVKGLLARAQSRRSVAATLMNERSSRSHSAFTLRVTGSERLNVSFGPGVTEKERVRETQSINKSLSALGDVIAALGAAGGSGSGASGNGGGAVGGVNGGNGGGNGVHIP
ncbi:hypothetical protein NMY22_g2980 [Coprinellus aureogranulatus]|nr:hypothetical protein NMY22_g2980 [Coprinellus aureogranulatus]